MRLSFCLILLQALHTALERRRVSRHRHAANLKRAALLADSARTWLSFHFVMPACLRGHENMQAVYTVLREAEYRSTYPLPYWNVPLLRLIVPRQRRCQEALRIINRTLDSLIAKSKRVVSAASFL